MVSLTVCVTISIHNILVSQTMLQLQYVNILYSQAKQTHSEPCINQTPNSRLIKCSIHRGSLKVLVFREVHMKLFYLLLYSIALRNPLILTLDLLLEQLLGPSSDDQIVFLPTIRATFRWSNSILTNY